MVYFWLLCNLKVEITKKTLILWYTFQLLSWYTFRLLSTIVILPRFFSGKITFDKQKRWCAKYCKSVKYTPIRWRCFWRIFTPPISQVTFAQIRGEKWIGIKQKSLITVWLSGILFILHWLFVIRLDFVPFGYFLALSVSFPRLYALS